MPCRRTPSVTCSQGEATCKICFWVSGFPGEGSRGPGHTSFKGARATGVRVGQKERGAERACFPCDPEMFLGPCSPHLNTYPFKDPLEPTFWGYVLYAHGIYLKVKLQQVLEFLRMAHPNAPSACMPYYDGFHGGTGGIHGLW